MRLVLETVAACVLAVPVAFLVMVAAVPVLRRAEAATGLELVGHSGPAASVIAIGYLVIAVALLALIHWLGTDKESPDGR